MSGVEHPLGLVCSDCDTPLVATNVWWAWRCPRCDMRDSPYDWQKQGDR